MAEINKSPDERNNHINNSTRSHMPGCFLHCHGSTENKKSCFLVVDGQREKWAWSAYHGDEGEGGPEEKKGADCEVVDYS